MGICGTFVTAIALVVVELWFPAGCRDEQSRPATPESAEARRLDFWIGDWDVTWPGGRGRNNVHWDLGGHVVVERFTSPGLTGMSVSTFDATGGKWRQTWVDDQGGYLDFTGGFENGRMVLSRVAVENGKKVHQRMVWFNVTEDAFDWSWERSEDGGATWKVVWPIHYARRKG